MKTAKWKSIALMGMLAALASGCAADEEMSDKAAGGSGKLMTIMVGTESGSNTRVSYDEGEDDIPSLTWELYDKLGVAGYTLDKDFVGKKDYLLNAEDHGKSVGAFTGDKIGLAETYYVYYPHTIINESGSGDFTIGDQTQVGDKSTAHLKSNIILHAADVRNLNNITLSMHSSILKFALSGIPKEVGTLKELRWVVETATGEKTLKLAFSTASTNKIQFSDTKNDLTAYLAFMPEDMAIKPGGKFRVELIGNKIYQAETTVDAGKTYLAGHRYTALIDGEAGTMEWKPKMITLSMGTSIYDGFTMQIGYIRNDYTQESIEVKEFGIHDGKVSFEASLLPYPEAHSTIWFRIPKVVKFIYTPGPDGLGYELTLPDKDLGSTLNDNLKVEGKSYMNEWIVALYMGVDRNGDAGNVPIYWATGNLIATKVTAGQYNYEVSFHIATHTETQLESETEWNYFPGVDIIDDVNGYKNCKVGAQWNLFVWNTTEPTCTISDNGPYSYQIDGGDLGSYIDVSSYGLKKGFRLPFGEKNWGDNHREMSLLMGTVSGVSIDIWEVNSRKIGRKLTYNDANNIENTLYLPTTGWAIGTLIYNLGGAGYYWSGSSPLDDFTARVYHFEGGDMPYDDSGQRSSRYAMRPVTE